MQENPFKEADEFFSEDLEIHLSLGDRMNLHRCVRESPEGDKGTEREAANGIVRYLYIFRGVHPSIPTTYLYAQGGPEGDVYLKRKLRNQLRSKD